jgi:hypothetical protein
MSVIFTLWESNSKISRDSFNTYTRFVLSTHSHWLCIHFPIEIKYQANWIRLLPYLLNCIVLWSSLRYTKFLTWWIGCSQFNVLSSPWCNRLPLPACGQQNCLSSVSKFYKFTMFKKTKVQDDLAHTINDLTSPCNLVYDQHSFC